MLIYYKMSSKVQAATPVANLLYKHFEHLSVIGIQIKFESIVVPSLFNIKQKQARLRISQFKFDILKQLDSHTQKKLHLSENIIDAIKVLYSNPT